MRPHCRLGTETGMSPSLWDLRSQLLPTEALQNFQLHPALLLLSVWDEGEPLGVWREKSSSHPALAIPPRPPFLTDFCFLWAITNLKSDCAAPASVPSTSVPTAAASLHLCSLLRSGVLQFMQSKMALLQVDDFLFRSWFSLVPLESLTSYLENSTEYLSLVPARILDCLQGVSYRLRGLGKISDQNLEVCYGDQTSKWCLSKNRLTLRCWEWPVGQGLLHVWVSPSGP